MPAAVLVIAGILATLILNVAYTAWSAQAGQRHLCATLAVLEHAVPSGRGIAGLRSQLGCG